MLLAQGGAGGPPGLHSGLTPALVASILSKAAPDLLYVFGNAPSGVNELVGVYDPYRDLADSGTVSKQHSSSIIGGTVDRIDADTSAVMKNSVGGFISPSNVVMIWVGAILPTGAGSSQEIVGYRLSTGAEKGFEFTVDHSTGYITFIIDAGSSSYTRTVTADHRGVPLVILGIRKTDATFELYTHLGSATSGPSYGFSINGSDLIRAGARNAGTAAYAEHGAWAIWENNATAWSETERAAMETYLGY